MTQELPTLEGWQIGNLTISARGAKSAPVADAQGLPCRPFQLTDISRPLMSPWDTSVFDQDTKESAIRRNIEFSCTPQVERFVRELDSWCIREVARNSVRLLKQELTEEQVKLIYKSYITSRGSYPPTLKCTITVLGPKAVRCWNTSFGPRPPPPDWRTASDVPSLTLPHLWFADGRVGLSIQVVDVLILERPVVCPFRPQINNNGASEKQLLLQDQIRTASNLRKGGPQEARLGKEGQTCPTSRRALVA